MKACKQLGGTVRLPTLLLLLATALVGVSLLVVRAPPLEQQPQPDSTEYAESAQRLAHGLGYTTTVLDQGNHPPGANPPRYPIGYPLTLAPFTLVGHYPDNVQLGAKLITVALVVIVAWAAFESGGPWAGLIAVAVVGASPFVRWSAAFILADALSAALAVALLPLVRRHGARAAYAAGLLAGFGVAVRLSAVGVLVALLVALTGWNRLRAGLAALPSLTGLAVQQQLAFGAPWRTGYDYWLPGLQAYTLRAVTAGAGLGDGPGLFRDRLDGTLATWACHGCGAVGPFHSFPNWLFYPLVLAGIFWIFTPPLLALVGLATAAATANTPVGRLVIATAVAQLLLFLPYFYQSARFLAPAALMLTVLSATTLAALGRQLVHRRKPRPG